MQIVSPMVKGFIIASQISPCVLPIMGPWDLGIMSNPEPCTVLACMIAWFARAPVQIGRLQAVGRKPPVSFTFKITQTHPKVYFPVYISSPVDQYVKLRSIANITVLFPTLLEKRRP